MSSTAISDLDDIAYGHNTRCNCGKAGMNIALDYDGTFTAAPTAWLAFIDTMRAAGHSVWIVTMRYASECDGTKGTIDTRLRDRLVPVICTARMAKKPFCEKLGIAMHIWVDDHPEAVHNDASTIWGDVSPEGRPIIPHYPE